MKFVLFVYKFNKGTAYPDYNLYGTFDDKESAMQFAKYLSAGTHWSVEELIKPSFNAD